METETGVMLPQAKEHQEPPEAGRGKEGVPLEASEIAQTCQHVVVDSWPPELSWTVRVNSIVLSYWL